MHSYTLCCIIDTRETLTRKVEKLYLLYGILLVILYSYLILKKMNERITDS